MKCLIAGVVLVCGAMEAALLCTSLSSLYVDFWLLSARESITILNQISQLRYVKELTLLIPLDDTGRNIKRSINGPAGSHEHGGYDNDGVLPACSVTVAAMLHQLGCRFYKGLHVR